MTSYVLSHNLQVQDSSVPALSFEELATALKNEDASFTSVEALTHPHWKLKIESSLLILRRLENVLARLGVLFEKAWVMVLTML